MTWRTSRGNRVLQGMEAAVFRGGMGMLRDMLCEELLEGGESVDTGVSCFDELEVAVRLVVLAEVSWALLRKTAKCPVLTAYNEGAVAAVFELVRGGVALEATDEVEENSEDSWRTTIINTLLQTEECLELPSPNCQDMDEWDFLIDLLRDRILWDQDFLGQDTFLDKDPEQVRPVQKDMGIDRDYYAAAPPLARDPDVAEAVGKLQILLDDDKAPF